MILFPDLVRHETGIVAMYPTAGLERLPYLRLGYVVSHAPKLTHFCGPPYSLICFYAALSLPYGAGRRLTRVAYANVAGFPNHLDGVDLETTSDNLMTPLSFRAGKVETDPPQSFGLPKGGPLGSLKNAWEKQVAHHKARWDSLYSGLGKKPLTTSTEVLGLAYDLPF